MNRWTELFLRILGGPSIIYRTQCILRFLGTCSRFAIGVSVLNKGGIPFFPGPPQGPIGTPSEKVFINDNAYKDLVIVLSGRQKSCFPKGNYCFACREIPSWNGCKPIAF